MNANSLDVGHFAAEDCGGGAGSRGTRRGHEPKGESMRALILALALALLTASPAGAETLQEVTTKGVVLTLGGTDIEIAFLPDGKFTALNGAMSGTWRIDGDKLCTKGEDGNEIC